MLFAFMLTQMPHKPTPTDKPQVRTVDQMLKLFNHILTHAPEYNDTGLVGCPINAILDWAMGTHAGFAAFLNDRVNPQFKKMLNEWGLFLKSADSAGVLNGTDSGWFGPKAHGEDAALRRGFRVRPGAHRTTASPRGTTSLPGGSARGHGRWLPRQTPMSSSTPASRRPTG